MKASFEREDGELRSTWCLVQHARCDVLFGELDVSSSSLLLSAPHEGGLVCCLVCIGSGHSSEDLVKAFWCNRQDSSLDNISPIVLGEVS